VALRFLAGLRERGFEVGRALVLLVGIEQVAAAMRRKTSLIPIVLSSSSDLVAAGLMQTLARPGTNVIGMAALNELTAAKPRRSLGRQALGVPQGRGGPRGSRFSSPTNRHPHPGAGDAAGHVAARHRARCRRDSHLRFLGYDPIPEPTTLADRMLSCGQRLGLSIKEAALRAGVDESSWVSR